jgi:GT2 family glycosyltransferase
MADPYSSWPRPLVTAVIPTRDRPALLTLAVRSALRQTWPKLEVLVVVDGPDPATAAELNTIGDSRLRVLFLAQPSGGAEARNAGVRAARGEWIAFLDDDDEWLPEKIERQMRAAYAMPDWFPIVSCRLIAQSATASRILPLEPYEPPRPVADFLFCRKGLRDPGGTLQTSTLLAPRDLLLAVPFQPGLPMHQDWDWLIRAASNKGVGLSMLAQPLVLWRVDDDRATTGRSCDWQFSLAWIRHSRALISPRAFSWFVAIQCAWRARASRAGLLAKLSLLRACLVEGQPEFRSLLSFFIFAFLPQRLRRCLRKGFHPRHKAGDPPGLHLVVSRCPPPAVLRKNTL